MPHRSIESLGPLVKAKRGERKLRETALEIGIGPATLMRVESGRTPDLSTFGLICKWLGIDPGEFLGFEQNAPSNQPVFFSAHFRAEKMPNQKTVQCLAQMIAYVAQTQPHPQQVNA